MPEQLTRLIAFEPRLRSAPIATLIDINAASSAAADRAAQMDGVRSYA